MATDTVLVTGGNGFLGKSILSEFIDNGVAVFATDIGDKPAIPGVPYQKADITHLNELDEVIGRVSMVIHAAGLAHLFNNAHNKHELFRQINEIGAANVVKAAVDKGIRHLVLISSVSVYGPNSRGIYNENTPCNPSGPYALSKYNGEQRAIEIAQKSEMALTILRLATLYGEGDPGNVGQLIRSLDQRRFIWIGDGSNRKSLLYKGDAARACMAVASSPSVGTNIYNVSAPPCTMGEIVEAIADALRKQPLPLRVPGSLALTLSKILYWLPIRRLAGIHQTVQKWMAEDVYDSRLFNQTFNFSVQTSMKEGILKEVNSYLHGNIRA